MWKIFKPFEQLCVIVVTMAIFQLLITILLYFGGYHFHASYGFYGNSQEDAMECRRGWDWIPSVTWQFIWSWIIGPYYLVKSKHISDTHYWRIQIVISIAACLPGTPMWLIFLYIHNDNTQNVQTWLVAAFWYCAAESMGCSTLIMFLGSYQEYL